MNMVDMYLKMNSCERDKNNKVYFVDPVDNSKREFIGILDKVDLKDGTLYINVIKKVEKPIKFIQININMDDIKVEK